jgi:alpha-beta hydrolase superfamily lysophospholipase
MAWAHPWHGFKAGRNGYALVEKPEMAALYFLSRETPTDIQAFHAQLVPESTQVSSRLLRPILRHPESVTSPVLVIAGGKDFAISLDEQRRTAEALHAKYIECPEGPHDLMMEQGWQDVADTIDAWISHDLKLS